MSSSFASIEPVRIDQRSRLVDEVTHRLRELILDHTLQPGVRLLQIELADRLGVSRTPLREAIRLLEHEGLVRVSNGNRSVEVARLEGDELRDLYELREVVDGLAARLLARRGLTPAVRTALTASLASMRRSIFPLDGEAFYLAHLDFHTTIVEHSGNQRLTAQLPLVRLTAGSLRDEYPSRVRSGLGVSTREARRRAASTIAEHDAILRAIKRGDELEAESAARCHIQQALVDFVYSKDPTNRAT